MWPSAALIRVLLPMPGAPPTSTIEPCTRPPPSTRSNSALPVPIRSAANSSTSASACGRCAVAEPPPIPLAGPVGGSRRCSCSVFHSEQPGQRPAHFAVSWPQSLQQKKVVDFAISTTLSPRADVPDRKRSARPGFMQTCSASG